ncbi:UNVERIFIED_CONTAM: hypothetical protein K2H54_049923 [Gekko kuhli]
MYLRIMMYLCHSHSTDIQDLIDVDISCRQKLSLSGIVRHRTANERVADSNPCIMQLDSLMCSPLPSQCPSYSLLLTACPWFLNSFFKKQISVSPNKVNHIWYTLLKLGLAITRTFV